MKAPTGEYCQQDHVLCVSMYIIDLLTCFYFTRHFDCVEQYKHVRHGFSCFCANITRQFLQCACSCERPYTSILLLV